MGIILAVEFTVALDSYYSKRALAVLPMTIPDLRLPPVFPCLWWWWPWLLAPTTGAGLVCALDLGRVYLSLILLFLKMLDSQNVSVVKIYFTYLVTCLSPSLYPMTMDLLSALAGGAGSGWSLRL